MQQNSEDKQCVLTRGIKGTLSPISKSFSEDQINLNHTLTRGNSRTIMVSFIEQCSGNGAMNSEQNKARSSENAPSPQSSFLLFIHSFVIVFFPYPLIRVPFPRLSIVSDYSQG